jgi:pilus assembly protein CpaF
VADRARYGFGTCLRHARNRQQAGSVNGLWTSRGVLIERDGLLQVVPGIRLEERNLLVAVKNIARALGDDISEERPILDPRLPDGSRVAAVCPPCSVGGTTLTIRKFHTRFFTAQELVRIGTMPPSVLSVLRDAIERRETILVSGGTSTGKTTLLNALSAYLPDADRIVLIEDTAELQIDKPNIVRFEARHARQGLPEVTIRDLVRASLRHRPDRLIVGEVRGRGSVDLLQALNTGHAGSVHHPRQFRPAGVDPLRLLRRTERSRTGVRAVRHETADVRRLVLHLDRWAGVRLLRELVRILRYGEKGDRYETEQINAA